MDPEIVDGDLVLVKQAPDAESGERVVAHVGENEATVKRLRRRGRQVWLEAANPRYKRISGRPIRIIGKVVGLLRNW
jgi:repressor LexA